MEWLKENWKVLAALVYFIICLVDFVVVPAVIGYDKIIRFDKIMQMAIDHPHIVEVIKAEFRPVTDWIPFTLRGGGLFHIAFGAILTGAVLGKRSE